MTIRIKKTEEMKKADKARRNKEYYEKLKSGVAVAEQPLDPFGVVDESTLERDNVLRFGASKGQGRENYKPPKTPNHLIVKQGPITLKFD